MKSCTIKLFSALLAIASLLRHANVRAQEGISLDPTTGDYTVLYFATDDGGNETLRQTIFVPSTKIAPAVHSGFEATHDGVIAYRYSLKNNSGVPQAIKVFMIEPVFGIDESTIKSESQSRNALVTSPSPWKFRAVTRNGALRVIWRYPGAGGLWPSQGQPGFGLRSTSLPGIIAAGLSGNAPNFAGLGENGFDPDSALGKQFQQLVMHDYLDVWVAAPTVPVTNPVNVASTLAQFRTHVSKWSAQMLIDSTSAANLDSSFQAAVTALSQGNREQAASSLRIARDAVARLQRESDDNDEQIPKRGQLDRLTAGTNSLAIRVLLFDIRFLLRQLTGSE